MRTLLPGSSTTSGHMVPNVVVRNLGSRQRLRLVCRPRFEPGDWLCRSLRHHKLIGTPAKLATAALARRSLRPPVAERPLPAALDLTDRLGFKHRTRAYVCGAEPPSFACTRETRTQKQIGLRSSEETARRGLKYRWGIPSILVWPGPSGALSRTSRTMSVHFEGPLSCQL